MIQVLLDNPVPVLLVFFGVWFIVAEIFMPSFGALGISGGIAFFIGAIMLIYGETTHLNTAAFMTFGVTILALGFLLVVLNLVIRSRRHNVSTGAEGLRYSVAQVVWWSDQEGEVRAAGTTWKAVCADKYSFKKGDNVKILGVDDLRLFVVPCE